MTSIKLIFCLLLIAIFLTPVMGLRVRGWLPKIPPPVFKFPGVPKLPPPPPPTPKPVFIPAPNSKYCDESDISKIFLKKDRKRSISWPYHCKYASVMKYQGSYQFIYDVFTCCQKCDFPDYTTCLSTHTSTDWRCPSDGLHCLLNCVQKHGPGYTEVIKGGFKELPGISKAFGEKFETRPKIEKIPKHLNCERVEKRPDGTTCIRRLCVPLKI